MNLGGRWTAMNIHFTSIAGLDVVDRSFIRLDADVVTQAAFSISVVFS